MRAHFRAGRRARSIVAAAVLVAGGLVAQPPPPAAAAATVPFSITIRHINCVDPCDEEGLEDTLENTPDFYVKVWIDGVKQPPGSDEDDPSSPIIDDDDSIDPFWTISTMIPEHVVNVPVTIQVWDYDSTSGDDLADVSGHDADNNLDFWVVRQTGRWVDPTADGSGDHLNWPQNCSTGDGGGGDDEPRAKVCFDIGGDTDGDGLLDSWERDGYDDDGDGIVDVDLPAMGADPARKDLFLELDYADNLGGKRLRRTDVLAMKAAFAAAPYDAGWRAGDRDGDGDSDDTFGRSAPPDPLRRRGINLHVDTGNLIDPRAREGQAPGTCVDGVDNSGDGLRDDADPDCTRVDAGVEPHLDASVEDPGPGNCEDNVDNDHDFLTDDRDPDCLVGDAVFAVAGRGGGNKITDPRACGLDGNFYRVKNGAGGLNPDRRSIFRYAIRASRPSTCGKPSGGQGELGGNDFIVFNAGGGTIMHELGHTLNLYHGGYENPNCKPNYVSVMNYDLQYGIPRSRGGTILDFSPPRTWMDGSGRGKAPLGTLDEEELDENTVLDVGDGGNMFVFVNGRGDKVKSPLNARPNWNGDVDLPDHPYEDEVEANIDTVGKDGRPAACANDDEDELHGADDWSYVSLSFHGFGEVSDAALRPEPDPVPTDDDLAAMWATLNTTDLTVSQTDAPDPVAAGTQLTYTVVVDNAGPNPADSVQVTDTLPADVRFASASTGCAVAGAVVTCQLGHIPAAGRRSFTLTVDVPADLVYRTGGPKDITNTVSVLNLAGPDSVPGTNTSTATTRVVAVADVRVAEVRQTAPLEVLIGETSTASLAVGIDNLGPSSPIDTVLTVTGTGSPGVSVTPAVTSSAQDALAVGAGRTLPFPVRLDCTSPGLKTVQLTARLALRNAEDTDPDLTDNQQSTSFQIDCVVPIAINVRPGGFPNSVNLNTDATLAALTTTAGEYGLPLSFDATTIDVSQTRWGLRDRLFNVANPTGAVEQHGKGHAERSYELDEQTRDADADLVLHFKPSDSGLSAGTTQACLKGRYRAADGNTYTFLGCDSVQVVPVP